MHYTRLKTDLAGEQPLLASAFALSRLGAEPTPIRGSLRDATEVDLETQCADDGSRVENPDQQSKQLPCRIPHICTPLTIERRCQARGVGRTLDDWSARSIEDTCRAP